MDRITSFTYETVTSLTKLDEKFLKSASSTQEQLQFQAIMHLMLGVSDLKLYKMVAGTYQFYLKTGGAIFEKSK